jgi:hypothetical protein
MTSEKTGHLEEAAIQQTIPIKAEVKGFYESQTGSIRYVVSDIITGQSAIIDARL